MPSPLHLNAYAIKMTRLSEKSKSSILACFSRRSALDPMYLCLPAHLTPSHHLTFSTVIFNLMYYVICLLIMSVVSYHNVRYWEGMMGRLFVWCSLILNTYNCTWCVVGAQ
jgi:hypothetical protein